MVKLIVSDIDGTLIPYGKKELPEALFPLISRLRRAGVLFCPASGRQFHSLRKLFAPVAEELAFLCENGAAIFGPGTEADAPLLSKTPMPRAGVVGFYAGGQGKGPPGSLRRSERRFVGDCGLRR